MKVYYAKSCTRIVPALHFVECISNTAVTLVKYKGSLERVCLMVRD